MAAARGSSDSRDRRKLIDPRVEDQAQQFPQVVSARREFPLQMFQQSRHGGGLSGRRSSGSWTMPRPKIHAHVRFTAARANQRFPGASSQSAKATRGSAPGGTFTLRPVRQDGFQRPHRRGVEADDFLFPFSGGFVSRPAKTSPPCQPGGRPAIFRCGCPSRSARRPRRAAGVHGLAWRGRKFTGGTRKLLPLEVRSSRAIRSYGMLVRTPRGSNADRPAPRSATG